MTTDTIEGQQIEEADVAAEQAAAQAAFSQTRGSEPEPAGTVDPEKSAAEIEADARAAEQERAKQAAEEWLKGVPESVRESLSAISGVTGRLRNIEGHIGGLTSQTKELRTAMMAAKAATTAAGKDSPTDSQVDAASGSHEKWDQMREDFPEWWEAMEQRLSTVKGSPVVDLDAVRNQVREEISSEMQVDFLDTHRPDWRETLNRSEFRDYVLDGGPTLERYQQMKTLETTDPAAAKAMEAEFAQAHPEWWESKGRAFFSPKAKDAVRLLDGFTATNKQDAPANQPARQDAKTRLESAVSPTKGSSSAQRREPLTEQEAAVAAWKRVRGG